MIFLLLLDIRCYFCIFVYRGFGYLRGSGIFFFISGVFGGIRGVVGLVVGGSVGFVFERGKRDSGVVLGGRGSYFRRGVWCVEGVRV